MKKFTYSLGFSQHADMIIMPFILSLWCSKVPKFLHRRQKVFLSFSGCNKLLHSLYFVMFTMFEVLMEMSFHNPCTYHEYTVCVLCVANIILV